MDYNFPLFIESLDEMLLGVDEKALKDAYHDLTLTPGLYIDACLIEPMHFERVKTMANAGDAKAYQTMGQCYETGTSLIFPDIDKAIEYYSKGAQLGSDDNMVSLGMLYCKLGKNEEAQKWFSKMHKLHLNRHAKNPSMQTEFDLAVDQSHGYGCKQDIETSSKTIEKLASKGCPIALLAIALEYRDGVNRRKNKAAYVKRLMQAAKLGNGYSCTLVSLIFINNAFNFKFAADQAFHWACKALELAPMDAQAQTVLGKCYLNGWGTEQDIKQALAVLVSAASLGDVDAEILSVAILKAKERCFGLFCSDWSDINEKEFFKYLSAAMPRAEQQVMKRRELF